MRSATLPCPPRAVPAAGPAVLRLTGFWLAVLTGLSLCPDVARAGDGDPVLLRGPYLQMANPNAVSVCWRTEVPGTGRVRYGSSAGALSKVAEEQSEAINHEVRLTGLAPTTHYFYAVETNGALLAGGVDCHFYTPPPAGTAQPVRFWVLGDAGTQSLAQRMVRDAFAPLHAQRPADFWLMLGDNAYYSGTDEQFQAAVFETYPEYLRTLPLWSCIGNHETYGGVDEFGRFAWDNIFVFPANGECGGMPSGTERYYSWNFGPVHFIALDSMTVSRAPDGPMARWLTEDLAANVLPWSVAIWHHPPYSRGSHNSDFEIELIEMRNNIVPILENFGVDLVLCGHSHNYERSYLLDGHYGLSSALTPANRKGPGSGREDADGPYYKAGVGMTPRQGTVYITAGSSGQTGGGLLDHPAHFIAMSQLGSLVVDVDGTRMDVKFLREAVAPEAPPVFDDYFTIVKGVEPPPFPQLTRGPYLQMASPNAMTVRWRTDLPAGGRVRFGTALGALHNSVAEPGGPGTEHTVRLTDLQPGTRYYYTVDTGGFPVAFGPRYFFTTPPEQGSTAPVRIWALGDAGTQTLQQLAVRDGFVPVHAERPPDLWLLLGDNAYGVGNDDEYQAAIFDTYHPWLEQVPLWSCIGNHETYGDGDDGRFAWDKIFDFPAAGECGGVASGTERYYSWNHGNIHFVALDSMTSSRMADGPMAAWLAADLAANTADWTIAFWHHPPYTKGTHDSDFEIELVEMRENILPILEQYGTDLVLCAHSHVYERSFLLDGHYGTSDTLLPEHILNARDGREDGTGLYVKTAMGPSPHEGTVYVVAGSSGQYGVIESNHPAHFLSLNQLGSVVIDVQGSRLDVRFLRETYDPESAPLFDDYFTVLKGGPVAPDPPTGLAVLPLTDTSAVLHWKDNSLSEDRCEVMLSELGVHYTSVALLPPDTSGFTLTSLQPGKGYYAKVVVSNPAGTASSTPFQFVQPAGPAPVSPLDHWRFAHWGTVEPGGDHADLADYDLDGLVNLLEYALDSSPRTAASVPVLTPSLTADGRLALTFNRIAAPALTYSVEFSPNAAQGPWQEVFRSSGDLNVPGMVTVVDPAPGDHSHRFVRLKVTLEVP